MSPPTKRRPRSRSSAPATTRSSTWTRDQWTEELVEEAEAIEPRLDEIEAEVESRARFKREDFAIAGCIATIGRDGSLQVIQGLVKPEDMPEPAENAGATGAQSTADGSDDTGADSSRIAGPAMSTPMQQPKDREAEARKEAGVGIGLADDLRSIRTALVKAHLAEDFEAAFDLTVFQLVRAVFARGYTTSWHALDIAFNETADRPTNRTNDDDFAGWSRGETMLADWSHLPFEWMEGDDDAACFAALRALPRADKEKLFAAAVARTVKGQLAFEHDARPELEATVARLDIDFAKHVRPTADMLWSRIRKDRILDIARQTLGTAWASARSKYKKADLAKAMQEAFAAGTPPVGIGATAHAAALAWTMPGFAAFDTGGADDGDEAEAPHAGKPAETPDASGDATAGTADASAAPEADAAEANEGPAKGNGHDASTVAEGEGGAEPVNGEGGGEDRPADPSIADAIDAMNAVPTADGGPRVIVQTVGPVNGRAPDSDPLDIPEFLRRVH